MLLSELGVRPGGRVRNPKGADVVGDAWRSHGIVFRLNGCVGRRDQDADLQAPAECVRHAIVFLRKFREARLSRQWASARSALVNTRRIGPGEQGDHAGMAMPHDRIGGRTYATGKLNTINGSAMLQSS
ncbi:hypothetical protein [Sphingomonas sp.]|uniref:hypothetical protein n=1 Tax=Sphingomonas sp. TaxID=28214 RepID=UPI0025FE7CC0|nr:hypothetical protein [Sphingomonas sp.]MBV9528291.1 hypothetical protein [Sphingomonas sp.]